MLKLTNRKTVETFSYKYIVLVNNKKFQILSNLDEKTVQNLMLKMCQSWEEMKSFKILDCIEFEYTDANKGITFDVLRNYL